MSNTHFKLLFLKKSKPLQFCSLWSPSKWNAD